MNLSHYGLARVNAVKIIKDDSTNSWFVLGVTELGERLHLYTNGWHPVSCEIDGSSFMIRYEKAVDAMTAMIAMCDKTDTTISIYMYQELY